MTLLEQILIKLAQPTEAQAEAGNYKKKHIRYNAMEISIENPAGSVRKGTSPDGKEWKSHMYHHYGYIRGTLGRDKDHIDVFIKPGTKETEKVFIINQDDGKGKFDEHKCMLGFNTEAEAKKAYLSNYEKGWKCGPIVEMSIDDFKKWVYAGRKMAPAKGKKMNKKASLQEIYYSSFNNELEKISKKKKDDYIETGVKSYIGAKLPSAALSVPIVANIVKKKKELGVDYMPKEHKSENLSKLKKSMNIGDDVKVYKNTPLAYKGGGGAYMPGGSLKKTVHYIGDKKTTPFQRAILSHELGHAKDFKRAGTGGALMALRMAGMAGMGAGSLGAAFSTDDEKAKKYAIGGTALGAAGFAEEGVATAKGVKGLSKYYGGGAKGFGKALFKGKGGGARMIGMNLASYGLGAASPAITYKIRKMIKGESKAKKKDK